KYLAPWIRDLSPLSATHTMYVVGVIEVLAGVLVALKPRYAAYVVAAWLAGIIVNLLTYSGFYDVALRDFGLMLGALTLARLASRSAGRVTKTDSGDEDEPRAWSHLRVSSDDRPGAREDDAPNLPRAGRPADPSHPPTTSCTHDAHVLSLRQAEPATREVAPA